MISLTNALDVFWNWRLSTTPVEVDWFVCQPGKAAMARVSLDGLVTQVDPSGIVTVGGEGREIELDLRPCSFRRLQDVTGRGTPDTESPDSILQIDFPTGEVCLVLPNRRVSSPHQLGAQILHGLQWSRSTLGLFSTEPKEVEKPANSGAEEESTDEEKKKAPPPKIVKIRPPLMPVVSVLLTIAVILLVVVPLQIPEKVISFALAPQALNDPTEMVWVIPSEGSYYCSGSVMHGREPGKLMAQGQALTLGYQPALGHYCPGEETPQNRPEMGELSRILSRVQSGGYRVLSRVARLPGDLWSQMYVQWP